MANNLVRLLAGDWSSDGHGITGSRIISTDLTSFEVAKAIHDAIIDLELPGTTLYPHKPFHTLSLCKEYEHGSVPIEYAEKLGLPIHDPHYLEHYVSDGECMIDSWENPEGEEEDHNWFMIYVRLIKHSRPEAHVEFVKMPTITIGGYGLYTC